MFKFKSPVDALLLQMACMLISLLMPSLVFAQPSVAGLEERMSQKDFEASGLGKLSADELRHLNAWLAGRPVVVGTDGRVSAEPVFYANDKDREVIQTRISGGFRGWNGKTRFTLDNDQVWQQAESGSFGNIEINNPEVRIRPMLMGSWLMYVDGCGCSVRVKRIK